MNTNEIKKHMNNDKFFVFAYDTVGSTNTLLKEMANDNAEEFTVVVANHQTNGRGRKDRTFFSPKNTGLYFSLLLRPNIPPDKALYLTTCASVCCARAIEDISGEKAQIKWVNDVYVNNHKVCGILTEASFSTQEKLDYAVVGIGLNVFTPKEDFPLDLQNKAGSILNRANDEVRWKLFSNILNYFDKYYPTLEKKQFIDEYKNRSMITGKKIEILGREENNIATAVGINDDFSLRVLYPDGAYEDLNSGDVSIIPTMKPLDK